MNEILTLFAQPDKHGHFIAGMVVYRFLLLLFSGVAAPRYFAVIIAFCITCIIAFLKELWDYLHGGDPDLYDFFATILGAFTLASQDFNG